MADSVSIIADMVQQSERHANDLSKDRLRAIEYYQGKMKDTPSDAGRSSMTTRDVRANIKKVLPSIMRTILNADEVVEFLPVGEGDEEGATQASDYMNYVVLPESDAHDAIYDAIHDALLLRNGVLKWWYDEKQCVKISKHTGLNEDAMAELVASDEVQVLEQDEYVEEIETDEGVFPVTMYDIKIRRTFMEKEIRCAAVPRERFLIHPDAVTLDDSLLTGEKTTVTRSDLIAMGYDRELVDGLALASDDDEEEDARRDTVTDNGEAQRANDPIDFYDIYVRVDMDGDGIAELRHMTFAGGLAEKNLLEDDEVDEVQFCDVCVMRQPHQWEGISLADDLMDIQRGKTVLLRQTLDNIYWQNNPQPIGQSAAINNWDAVLNPEFGLPIDVKQGVDVRAALGFNQVPFVARDSFGMMEYLDSEAQDRTGVSDASAGLAPDALQNMTAKASAMIEQAGIGQTEMMVKTVAQSLRKFFRGLLRLSIRHQDMPRTVRLRGKWVQMDPRQWNADMDCAVNTGLGAGTRERDMQMMQVVMGVQEKLLTAFGPDNPFVTPENLFAAMSKMVESAGLKTPAMYFTQPDPEQMKARLEAEKNQKSPEQVKMEAMMQLEDKKMQTNTAREQAQMQADLQVKQAEIAAEQQKQADKLASDAALQDRKLSFEREKFMADLQFKREQAAGQRQDAIWQAQAQAMTEEAAEGAAE
ncbi:portal protein [Sulfitobacter phage phiGT1]|nr:portal protein [Sulfitobacter phage phiGT1]